MKETKRFLLEHTMRSAKELFTLLFNSKYKTDFMYVYKSSAYLYLKNFNNILELYGVKIITHNEKIIFYIYNIYPDSDKDFQKIENYFYDNFDRIRQILGYDEMVDIFDIEDEEYYEEVKAMVEFVLENCNYHEMLDVVYM